LCREAGLVAIRENIAARKVTIHHFDEALKLVRPSVDAEALKFYETFSKQLLRERVARKTEEAVQAIYR